MHWGDVENSEIALWALYPSRRLLSPRVSAFLDFLRQTFPKGTPEELAAYIGGRVGRVKPQQQLRENTPKAAFPHAD